MRWHAIVAGIAAATLAGCCNSDCPETGGVTVPAGVTEVEDLIDTGIADVVNTVSGFLNLQLLITDPDGATELGITFDPDPKGPPNQFLFEFPYDSDGDGDNDATATGTILIPTSPGGTGSVDFNTMDPDGTGMGLVEFRLVTGGVEVWGGGSTSDTATGITVEFNITEPAPVTIATDPGGEGNLCEFDVQGPIDLTATAPTGIIDLFLRFYFGISRIELTDRFFTEPGATEPQPLPDSTIELRPCEAVDIDLETWVGSWRLAWFCVPLEDGLSRVTFSVSGTNTLHGEDDAGFSFTATADAGNPRVVRGFFIDTDSAGTYREDFIFTMAPDGQSWAQDNTYVYTSGPAQGSTGACGGTATRLQ